MITRRALISTGMAGLLAGVSRRTLAAPPAPSDPAAIVNAIYVRAAKGKGKGGGAFIIENKAAKAKYLSKPLAELTPEKLDADTAVVAVTLTGHGAPPSKAADQVIRYNFVRDNGQWKIDDISGASDGEPWSIRDLLKESLKEVT
jgi:hypothetical protein